ncbi:hypothetical protein C7Y58_02095 [Fusobacterium nucleatum subsp. nucleatum ATCC 25586]|uniref:Uncharacterized protein n=1 Tax=Fusobacterium nucleatum subsp. nucleatum (strain ATCC 25586 / DSM 15643 / BCRC 10681 / CIP 101130 / JCM 8532 / KCTC 2640 / LMG 13131 / VPI 4355) TaxID=190304 RepID=Q8RH83_FUSNN|nr:unknown [Fusobacterium nucleatum subsp. nucleatum ATCC 25586]AVQ14392.1 hypothetical protein C7Y58_02095 [Fusobacterium nucleatum subsp. nucleatum ATCC 25586]
MLNYKKLFFSIFFLLGLNYLICNSPFQLLPYFICFPFLNVAC